jgi:DNA-binding transcriptional LysR family regulator
MRQSTASTHIRTLEAAVGHRLVERSGRETRLTDAGRLVAHHAAGVVSALERLEAELAALAGATAGSLVVASCDTFGNYVLPTVLLAFIHDRPRVEIHVRIGPSGEMARAVAAGKAHVGIVGQARRSERVVAEPLLRDELAWIASSRSHAVPRTISVADIQRLTVIVTGRESSMRMTTERILSRLGCHPARLIELESAEAVKRAVRSELGIALVSRLAVADELAGGELRTLQLLRAGPAMRTIDLVRAEQRTPTPLEQAFAVALRRHCAEPRRPVRQTATASG